MWPSPPPPPHGFVATDTILADWAAGHHFLLEKCKVLFGFLDRSICCRILFPLEHLATRISRACQERSFSTSSTAIPPSYLDEDPNVKKVVPMDFPLSSTNTCGRLSFRDIVARGGQGDVHDDIMQVEAQRLHNTSLVWGPHRHGEDIDSGAEKSLTLDARGHIRGKENMEPANAMGLHFVKAKRKYTLKATGGTNAAKVGSAVTKGVVGAEGVTICENSLAATTTGDKGTGSARSMSNFGDVVGDVRTR